MMRIIVSRMYDAGRVSEVKLIHPYDIDLNNDEVLSEIKGINPTLSEAITHDIAKDGHSVAGELDMKLGSGSDAQDVSRLILIASLANIPGATHGLRESDIMEYLCMPGRDISKLKKDIVDYLPTQAWYIHVSRDGRLFYKNTQNLAAKLHSLADSYNRQSCIKELRTYLASNVINLTARLIIHVMFSLVDFMITLEFASWPNRFSGGHEDRMNFLDQLHNHFLRSFKKQKQGVFGF